MDRRLLGAGLLVLAVVVVSAVPALDGRRVAGSPVPIDVPPPPRVGHCLAELEFERRNGGSMAAADRVDQTVDCARPHVGEVIAVGPTASFPRTKNGSATVPDLGTCAEILHSYMGVAGSLQSGDQLGPWQPPASGRFWYMRPDELEQRAGAGWLACVVSSRHGPVTGSVADAYADRARANPLAICHFDGTVRFAVSVPCVEPHAAEVFGWRTADVAVTNQEALDASCRQLAQRLTGMPDPTAGGALRVRTLRVYTDNNGVLQAGDPPVPWHGYGRAVCSLVAEPPRLLGDTLTGLGDRPVPFVE
jgi:hypothetical protein